MIIQKKGIEKLHVVIILLFIILSVFSTSLFGVRAEGKLEVKSDVKAGFNLTVEEDLISLNANSASLKEIIEEIGKVLEISVVGNIPEKEKISIDFEKLSLQDALGKLSTNYGFLMDSGKEGKSHDDKLSRIAKIIILPKGKETALADSTTKESVVTEAGHSEPFKFEFDPSEYMDKGN